MFKIRIVCLIATILVILTLVQEAKTAPTIPLTVECFKEIERVTEEAERVAENVKGGTTSSIPNSATTTGPKNSAKVKLDHDPQRLPHQKIKSKENVNPNIHSVPFKKRTQGQTRSGFSQADGNNKEPKEKGKQLQRSINSRRVQIKQPVSNYQYSTSGQGWGTRLKVWFIDPWKKLFQKVFKVGKQCGGSAGLCLRPLQRVRRAAFLSVWPALVILRTRCLW
ncbi:hypothetical protein CROQUDRAFT_101211 [Cronartium quercuum f. sp. fusiforme G11]|uniref:Uncharacterized protein n=1 Tax=Cronartium quercuum f. sp. fusiforme G11 TaxID=708437 RepID=A0A9P6T5B1_9BASI|nr:hypothetical protein CROQUDRAFT_101211 [Cronartium quercuum f. sp. fusiforme G11]